MPKFVFNRPVQIEDPKKDVEAIAIASQLVPIAQSYVYDRYDIPVPKAGEVLIGTVEQEEDEPPADDDDTTPPDDEQMMELRSQCWENLRPLYQQIASQVFSKVKDTKVLDRGDLKKAQGLGVPVNVGHIKDFYTDMLLYGHLLGRGTKVDLHQNRDQMLIDSGMTSVMFCEALRGYDEEAHRLAGLLKDRFTKAARRVIVNAVAEKQSEGALWAMLSEVVDSVGIDNFDDAPDIQALEIGYFAGRKEV
jgi:hypothetical protein